jgi:hypothetical protein
MEVVGRQETYLSMVQDNTDKGKKGNGPMVREEGSELPVYFTQSVPYLKDK